MRASQRFRRIVFAADHFARGLPGLVNEMSLLIKVTPVLAVVGVVDITRARRAHRGGDLRTLAAVFWWRSPSTRRSSMRSSRCSAGSSGRQAAAEVRRMIHDFGIVWSERSLLLGGARQYGDPVGAGGSRGACSGYHSGRPPLMSRQRLIASAAQTLVDGMRCIPFLLFAYIIYYGLPVARSPFLTTGARDWLR